MEYEEMLEQANETENVETQTTEENVEGIELTDTTEEVEEDKETIETEEKTEVKSLRELLKEHPKYQEEFNGMMKTRLDRKDREYQKELSKYRSTEEVLKKGLNATDITDAESKLREFWKAEGISLPEPTKPGLTDNEIRILAKAEADEIIESGDAEVEANKLASKGYDNMSAREREMFNTLAEHLTKEKKINELKSIGVKADLLDSKEFKDFASKFNSNTSVKDIYDLYSKTHKEEKKIEKMGSMSTQNPDKTKTHYTDDEIAKLTLEDLDKPGVFEAVRRSMTNQN